MNKVITFLKEVKVEVAKVTWPTRKQVITYTLMVLVVCAFLAIYLGSVDALFRYLLNIFIIN